MITLMPGLKPGIFYLPFRITLTINLQTKIYTFSFCFSLTSKQKGTIWDMPLSKLNLLIKYVYFVFIKQSG